MAELQTNRSRSKNKRMNKKSTKVDLTPMVDLGFLLITFFVFTTTLSQQTAMKVDLPYDKTIVNDLICESCVLTVLLDKSNTIKYYEGAVKKDLVVKETGYSPEGIREILMKKRNAVKIARGNEDKFVLIIKPSQSCRFKNFVDIVDEVTICDIKRYYIDDLNESDKKLLKSQSN
ncbi:MAG: biopolymer transporter ExbD [Ferruginibacter sp.]